MNIVKVKERATLSFLEQAKEGIARGYLLF